MGPRENQEKNKKRTKERRVQPTTSLRDARSTFLIRFYAIKVFDGHARFVGGRQFARTTARDRDEAKTCVSFIELALVLTLGMLQFSASLPCSKNIRTLNYICSTDIAYTHTHTRTCIHICKRTRAHTHTQTRHNGTELNIERSYFTELTDDDEIFTVKMHPAHSFPLNWPLRIQSMHTSPFASRNKCNASSSPRRPGAKSSL